MQKEHDKVKVGDGGHDTAADADAWWGTRSADRGVVPAPPRLPRRVCVPRLEAPGR